MRTMSNATVTKCAREANVKELLGKVSPQYFTSLCVMSSGDIPFMLILINDKLVLNG